MTSTGCSPARCIAGRPSCSSTVRASSSARQVGAPSRSKSPRTAQDRPARSDRGPEGGQAGAEERGHRRADGGQRPLKKSHWGTLNGRWVPHDTRGLGVRLRPPLGTADRTAGQDAVEFFNLVLELHLSKQEKADLVAYMLCLLLDVPSS